MANTNTTTSNIFVIEDSSCCAVLIALRDFSDSLTCMMKLPHTKAKFCYELKASYLKADFGIEVYDDGEWNQKLKNCANPILVAIENRLQNTALRCEDHKQLRCAHNGRKAEDADSVQNYSVPSAEDFNL